MTLSDPKPIGLTALIQELNLRVPLPAVQSEIVFGARRTLRRGNHIVEQYPRGYAPDDSFSAQLKFALRYEPVDLSVLHGVFHALGAPMLETWIGDERTGIFARRAWYDGRCRPISGRGYDGMLKHSEVVLHDLKFSRSPNENAVA
jgi:hypothetical protein